MAAVAAAGFCSENKNACIALGVIIGVIVLVVIIVVIVFAVKASKSSSNASNSSGSGSSGSGGGDSKNNGGSVLAVTGPTILASEATDNDVLRQPSS
jgi:uncharacterized membrane protein YgcG